MEPLGSNRQIGNGMQHLLFMVWYCLTRHGKFKKIYYQTCVIKERRGDNKRRYKVGEIEMGRFEFSIFGTSSKIAFPVVKKCCRQAVPDLHDDKVRLLSTLPVHTNVTNKRLVKIVDSVPLITRSVVTNTRL